MNADEALKVNKTSMKADKICIINVYFGTLPNTFPLWLKSAIANSTIDFMVVTDQNLSVKETNIKILHMSFDDCVDLVEKKLDMRVAINRPYKLCDFKPVYGVIFEDYLSGYDYWGHCDIDLIFGDIRYFCEKYNLNKYDKFLDEGHLSLYRNSKKCNQYYKLKGSYYDYNLVFTNEQIFVFDERNRINNIYKYNNLPIFSKRIYANINPAFKRFQVCDKSLKNYKQQVFCYCNGKIIRYAQKGKKTITDEFMYIHLLKRKMPDYDKDLLDSNSYCITDKGFFISDLNKKEFIERYSFYSGFLYELKEKIINGYRYNWQPSSIKRRLSSFLFKFKLGRKLLGKDF